MLLLDYFLITILVGAWVQPKQMKIEYRREEKKKKNQNKEK